MARLNASVTGAVYINGTPYFAGDDVPDAAAISDSLLDFEDTADVARPRPKGNASKTAWSEYATDMGVEIQEDWTTVDIKAAVEALDTQTGGDPA